MVDWELTATTIYCEDVDDEVTFLINSDGTYRCTGKQKYTQPSKLTAKEVKMKSKLSGKRISCNEKECRRVIQYRDKLLGK